MWEEPGQLPTALLPPVVPGAAHAARMLRVPAAKREGESAADPLHLSRKNRSAAAHFPVHQPVRPPAPDLRRYRWLAQTPAARLMYRVTCTGLNRYTQPVHPSGTSWCAEAGPASQSGAGDRAPGRHRNPAGLPPDFPLYAPSWQYHGHTSWYITQASAIMTGLTDAGIFERPLQQSNHHFSMSQKSTARLRRKWDMRN